MKFVAQLLHASRPQESNDDDDDDDDDACDPRETKRIGIRFLLVPLELVHV